MRLRDMLMKEFFFIMTVSDRFSKNNYMESKGRCMNDEDRILEDIKEILKELDEQGRMKYTQRYMQHSDISVYKHCISVAYTSVELAERFSLNVNRKELIRGALLHDYFLYDWHEKNAGHRFHGFIHAGQCASKCQK